MDGVLRWGDGIALWPFSAACDGGSGTALTDESAWDDRLPEDTLPVLGAWPQPGDEPWIGLRPSGAKLAADWQVSAGYHVADDPVGPGLAASAIAGAAAAVVISEPAGQHPRLVLRQIGGVIRVETNDAALADQLARQGLDRLVLPVPLWALEELLAFAG